MPGIRTLAKKFEVPAAAPNVYTGIESVLPLLKRMTDSSANPETPSKRSSRTSAVQQRTVSDTQILALIATLFLYIHTKMKDEDITPEQYKEWRELTVESLLSLSHAKGTSYEDLSAEIEDMLPLAQSEGWLGMEWFLNVEPLVWGEGMEGVESTGGGGKTSKRKGEGMDLKSGGSEYIGLGTMMQDGVDFLGEKRRKDYGVWRESIMRKIEEIEAR